MAYPYANYFDTTDSNGNTNVMGSIASEWVNIGSANFVIGTQSPVSSPNSFSEATTTNGDACLLTGESATPTEMFFSTRIEYSSGTYEQAEPILCANAGNTQGYLLEPNLSTSSPSVVLYKKTAGSYAQVGSSYTWPTGYASGTPVNIKFAISGTQLQFKNMGLWNC